MRTETAALEDLKAAIAAEIASTIKRKDRVETVAGTLQIGPDEARKLIKRGQRIARDRLVAQERAA